MLDRHPKIKCIFESMQPAASLQQKAVAKRLYMEYDPLET
jgi:hypothetical protein